MSLEQSKAIRRLIDHDSRQLRFLKQQLADIRQDGNAWPTKDVLSKLIEAAETLLNHHDYDGHGYEEILAAVDQAKRVVAKL